ncbi:phosphotransferase family protein [Agromyces sp. SYSU T00194]|uniref:phosphotransferase family protein n=1 Tax=Agromyces chitinivorans TaxID=3158560 RepID=UPI00339650F6
MVAAFTEQVRSVAWRDATRRRVQERLGALGIRTLGPLLQRRVRPWSTQLTVETDIGRVWCKHDHPALGFESRLLAELARRSPGSVPEPLAIDADAGLLLTVEHGASLADRGATGTDTWTALVVAAARLQHELADHRAELLAAGLPDHDGAVVVDHFDDLVARLAETAPGHPAHLEPDEAARLRDARPAVADAVRRLADSPYPAAWNHGDLHPGNAHAAGDDVRLFDLADGQWANALEVLAVPRDWIARRRDVAWAPVRDAWSAEWGVRPPRGAEWRAMRTVHAVNRAVTWTSLLDGMTHEELLRWGGYAPGELRRVLRRTDAAG